MGGLGGTDGQPEHHSPKGGGSMILRADHRLKQKREWPPTAVCFPISHQKLSSALINPLGVEGPPNASKAIEAFMYALIVVGASSMLARLRHAGRIERQQIKSFAYATVSTR